MGLHEGGVVQVLAPAVIEGVGERVVPVIEQQLIVEKEIDAPAVTISFRRIVLLIAHHRQLFIIFIISFSPEDLLFLLIIDPRLILQVTFVGERRVVRQKLLVTQLLVSARHSRKDKVAQLVADGYTGQQGKIVVQ